LFREFLDTAKCSCWHNAADKHYYSSSLCFADCILSCCYLLFDCV